MLKKTRRLLAFVFIFIFSFQSVSYGNIGIEKNIKAYYVGVEDGQELLDYNGDETLAIASLTKIMTYLVVKDEIANGKIDLTELVAITEEDTQVPGSKMGLELEESYTVEELLEGLMIVSGNDTAFVLAKHTAQTEENFVSLMNQKAEEIGLTTYEFHNASGYPYDGISNKMSAKDLYKLTDYTIKKYPEVLETTKKPVLDLPDHGLQESSTIPLLNENLFVDGFKTGTTDEAGYCLISTFLVPQEEEEDDFRAIAVMLNTESKDVRSKMARYIIDYVQSNFVYQDVVQTETPYETVYLNQAKNPNIELFPEESLKLLYNKQRGISTRIELDENIKLPLEKGDSLGTLAIEPTGLPVEEIDLIIQEDIEPADSMTRLKRTGRHLLSLIRDFLYI